MNSSSPISQKKKPKGTIGLRHKAGHDPRAAALSSLYAVIYEGADSQAALDQVLSSAYLMPTDKRLCTELVYGALRWHLRLRSAVDSRLKNPEKLPREMRLVLEAALYELAALRIPAHATVNWAVQHIRNRFGAGLSGVANGVLRALQGDLPSLRIAPARLGHPAPGSGIADDDETLARLYAMPVWIVGMWRKQYGLEETLLLLNASQQTPPAGVRLNKSSKGWQNLHALLVSSSPDESANNTAAEDSGQAGTVLTIGDCVLSFAGGLPWHLREPLRDGRAARQSAASYEALLASNPAAWPRPIWDACAGRGGKTLALLEAGIPVALASDPAVSRLRALPEEFQRQRLAASAFLPCLRVGSAADVPQIFASAPASFYPAADTPLLDAPAVPKTGIGDQPSLPSRGDAASMEAVPCLTDCPDRFGAILVDAPCSGLGTLARRPEIRLRRSPDDCSQLVATQQQILDSAWTALLPGGLLIYLTCTRNKAENQEQTAAFLNRHSDAVLEGEFETPAGSPLREFFYSATLRKAAK